MSNAAVPSAGMGTWLNKNARYIFPLPALLVVGLIIAYPIVYTIWMSMHQWSASAVRAPAFIGVDNYLVIARDGSFWAALVRTFAFTIFAVVIEVMLGVGMAVLFNRQFWGRGVLRTLSILPMMATPTAISLVFVLMYHPSLGVLNHLLSLVGLPGWSWTYSSDTALLAIALVDVWQWTPLIMLIALAGLSSLPRDPYEAARIDGATSVQMFFLITLPLLRPVLMVAILFRGIDALKTFDIIYVMTQGGPANASETVNILLFNQAFSYFNLGYASAISVALFSIILGCSLLLMKFRRGAW